MIISIIVPMLLNVSRLLIFCSATSVVFIFAFLFMRHKMLSLPSLRQPGGRSSTLLLPDSPFPTLPLLPLSPPPLHDTAGIALFVISIMNFKIPYLINATVLCKKQC